MYFWARLPQGVKSGTGSKLFQQALAKNVFYVPGELCYASDPAAANRTTKCASASAARRSQYGKGIARLGDVLQEFLAR